jgi:hypothetical protein
MSGSNSFDRDVSSRARTADQPLDMAVHGLPTAPLDGGLSRTRAGRRQLLLILLVCAAPVLASYLMYFGLRPGSSAAYGTLIQPSRTLPADLPLRTLQGQPVAAEDLRRQWLVVVVAAGHCDTACEAALYLQRQLRETLGRERDRVDKLWLIPDDTEVRPEVLAAVTGGPSPATVLRVPRSALARWLEPAAGQTLESHFYVVDPMGEWMMRWPAQPEPARFKRDMERLLRASAFWDRAGR